MLEYLKRPCPILDTNRSKFLLAFSVAVFVFLFLITFQPFGILDEIHRSKLFVATGYALIAFVLCQVYTFVWNGYAAKKDINVTVGMSILVAFILITIIGITNHFFGLYVHNPEFIKQETLPVFFTKSVLFTHAVGLFPFVFITFHFESKLRTYHLGKSASFVAQKYEVSNNLIVIAGEGQDQSIEFTSDSFRFARASGNYVEFHLIKEGAAKKELQRLTLSKLEEQFAQHSFPTMKTHRSYIVNLSKIESVNGNAQGYALKLDGLEERVPVSRYKVNDFNDLMNGTINDNRH